MLLYFNSNISCVYLQQPIYLSNSVFRLLPEQVSGHHQTQSYPWPSPVRQSSDWMAELAAAVQSSESPGGDTGNILGRTFDSNTYQPDTTYPLFQKIKPLEEDPGHVLFSNLKLYPKLRQSLNSVNSARAYKYGSRAFGQKSWYTENFDIATGLKSNADRRKFRFGLKSNVDFLIQLDIEGLKQCLSDKTFSPNHVPPGANLSTGSFLDTMRILDPNRFRKFCTIFNRIQANLDFTQSLSDYFATDEMLEPALLVISDAIRRGLNLRTTLRGGSVAANAQMYRHRAPASDREFSSRRPPTRDRRTENTSPTFRKRPSTFARAKYPVGTCWSFQSNNECNKSDCTYDHSCCHCFSKKHGKASCPDVT